MAAPLQLGDTHALAPFLVAARVGSPATEVKLVLDSSSGVTWLFGDDCASAVCERRQRYAPNGSATAWPTPRRFRLTMRRGASMTGRVWRDRFVLAHASPPLNASSLPIAVVSGMRARRKPSMGEAAASSAAGDLSSIDPSACTRSLQSLPSCSLYRRGAFLPANASGVLGLGPRDADAAPAPLLDAPEISRALHGDVFTLEAGRRQGEPGTLHLGRRAGAPATVLRRARNASLVDGAAWAIDLTRVRVRAAGADTGAGAARAGRLADRFGSALGERRGFGLANLAQPHCRNSECIGVLSSALGFILGPPAVMSQLSTIESVDEKCRRLQAWRTRPAQPAETQTPPPHLSAETAHAPFPRRCRRRLDSSRRRGDTGGLRHQNSR